MGTFPFGAPVLPLGAEVPDRTHPFAVVGAYPSALHVRWTPPAGFGRAVQALPVDNEPTPLWDGATPALDHAFRRWHDRFFDPAWGQVSPARLNGSSGRALEERWLRPLGCTRGDTFITDCLTTARASNGVAARLADRYAPVVEATSAPAADLGRHPLENDIVAEALATESDRLMRQFHGADPDVVVTLGNAAARVVATLIGEAGQGALRPDDYGRARPAHLNGRLVRWYALIHPAAPSAWQARHTAWLATSTAANRVGSTAR